MGCAWAPEAMNVNIEKINEKNTFLVECILISSFWPFFGFTPLEMMPRCFEARFNPR
jgi:hypothetical protein